VQRGAPRDAAKFFIAAVQSRSDYAPAILNLATVNEQFLHDHKSALENCRTYLALTPRPANWAEVNALAGQLEQSSSVIVAEAAPVERPNPPAPAPESRPPPRVSIVSTARPPVAVRPPPVAKNANSTSLSSKPAPAGPVQVVQVAPEPRIVTTPGAAADNTISADAAASATTPNQKPGIWHRLFGPKRENPPNEKYFESGLTPLPSADGTPPVPAAAKPVEAAPVPEVTFARYSFLSPRKPPAGDRYAASGAFTRAREYEQDEKWPAAMQWYQQAAEFDPSWFEAQYNTGVLAYHVQNYSLALPHYETALAINPDSTDARYNFALALAAAGYVPDAVNELKKILKAKPGEARAHLELANIYAQSLHDNPEARPHYLKVLELEPDNPKAAQIGFWLSENPK
jgi:tetratricopeptide (TPR) repeat protein